MPKNHHLFVLDPIETLNIKLDSSLRIARALSETGDQCFVCSPNDIHWTSQEACAAAFSKKLVFNGPDLQKIQFSEPEFLPLDRFQAVHMRKDPPYDLNYIACTWLLDSAAKCGVTIFNSPESLRNLNEKLSIFRFPKYIRPALLSTQPNELLSFIETHANFDAILKPLTLFGGRGVIRLNLFEQGKDAVLRILEEETSHGKEHRLIQPFDKAIFQGEVRVFTSLGRPVSWCLKKPSDNNFLANTRSGATLEPYEPSKSELEMVQAVASDLLKHGVYFAGFDIIGGYISEINITSPRLLQAPSDRNDYYSILAQDIRAQLA